MRRTIPRKLKADKNFQPFPKHEGDELYPNGTFEFNITELLKFVQANPNIFQQERVSVKTFRTFVSSHLNESTIQAAIITKPILLAEIAPDKFNVIDGNHRLERAYRNGIDMIFAYKVRSEKHISFLTSVAAYEDYIQYWNAKIKQQSMHVQC